MKDLKINWIHPKTMRNFRVWEIMSFMLTCSFSSLTMYYDDDMDPQSLDVGMQTKAHHFKCVILDQVFIRSKEDNF